MKRAVIFDLFETLVTEWDHEKYTKRQMSADLQAPFEEFSALWESLHEKQYRGEITFRESLRYVCDKLGISLDDRLAEQVTARRKTTKAACFDHVLPEVYELLMTLRKSGYRIAVLSNCSEEEVDLLRESPLTSMADCIILSYETGLCKPDPAIYRLTAERLGATCENCLFIGDGGSRELYGAAEAGMQPYRAMWYIRQMPDPIKEQPEFEQLESPMDLLNMLPAEQLLDRYFGK